MGDWKIIGSDDLSQFELYNIRVDWQETADLSGKYPEKFAPLREQLIAHDAAVLKEGPDWWMDEKNAPPKAPTKKKASPKKNRKNQDQTKN